MGLGWCWSAGGGRRRAPLAGKGRVRQGGRPWGRRRARRRIGLGRKDTTFEKSDKVFQLNTVLFLDVSEREEGNKPWRFPFFDGQA